MRIGLIRMRYTPYGGAEVFLERFISGLIARGHGVDVFANSWPASSGVSVRHVPVWGPSFLKPLIFASNVEKVIKKAAPDVVISLERTHCQDIYRAGDGCHRQWLVARCAHVSWIKRLAIALTPFHMTMLMLEEEMFKSARLKMVAANSRMVKDDIQRHYGLPDEKICVIYNGIDSQAKAADNASKRAEIRASLGVAADSVVLLFVGSGFERKGLKFLIRALALLKDKADARLVVIGKGRPNEHIREAKQLGVRDRVIFKGPLKNARDYYCAGDIFVLPSIYEPFSNSCLEAMAASLPVITTSANGASELLTGLPYNGVVHDPSDAGEIAARITPLLDEALRSKAGRAVREAVSEYTMERNVSEFLRLVEKIAHEKISGS
ncbi:MAG: glycosyltransferase family 4 protein [Deltaproteobacteria bacterium]|nr:glycosyltransferase family 4 protein [Deltaproteobacteria bacterium]